MNVARYGPNGDKVERLRDDDLAGYLWFTSVGKPRSDHHRLEAWNNVTGDFKLELIAPIESLRTIAWACGPPNSALPPAAAESSVAPMSAGR
jgi:hypothetical protein